MFFPRFFESGENTSSIKRKEAFLKQPEKFWYFKLSIDSRELCKSHS